MTTMGIEIREGKKREEEENKFFIFIKNYSTVVQIEGEWTGGPGKRIYGS